MQSSTLSSLIFIFHSTGKNLRRLAVVVQFWQLEKMGQENCKIQGSEWVLREFEADCSKTDSKWPAEVAASGPAQPAPMGGETVCGGEIQQTAT